LKASFDHIETQLTIEIESTTPSPASTAQKSTATLHHFDHSTTFILMSRSRALPRARSMSMRMPETTMIMKRMEESVLDRVLTELGVPVQGTKKDKIREFKIMIGL
jgi:hypothetical protein